MNDWTIWVRLITIINFWVSTAWVNKDWVITSHGCMIERFEIGWLQWLKFAWLGYNDEELNDLWLGA